MKNVVIAPVGDSMDPLFIGIREFPTERVILLSPKDKLKVAEQTVKDLDRFKIPTQIIKIEGHLWEEMFKQISQINKLEKDSNLLLNVGTGSGAAKCAATSAAFVNGIKAFDADENGVMVLPVLKFSYYKLLSDKKMEILKVLHLQDCCSSLDELSKRTKMSLQLISYHINGNLKSDGLKQLGLVDTTENKGKIDVKLSTLGKLLIKGYL